MKKPFIILINKQNLLIYICIIILAFLLTSMVFPARGQCTVNTRPVPLAAYGIEPETPQDMDDPPFYEPPMPSRVVPISEVIQKGSEIPLEFTYNNPGWKRQAYKEYWHSKYRRWSYVPDRLHYAMHRIFTTYRTASVYYDFIHNPGIAEEFTKFKSVIPYPPWEMGKVNPCEKMVVMNYKYLSWIR